VRLVDLGSGVVRYKLPLFWPFNRYAWDGWLNGSGSRRLTGRALLVHRARMLVSHRRWFR
jgi:hypothetical protein